jgi:hypothetical protein
MVRDEKPTILKDLIAPEHLVQAIDNSLMHSGETSHGVTGVHFENYTIVVYKRKRLTWLVELTFKTRDTELRLQPKRSSKSDAEHA